VRDTKVGRNRVNNLVLFDYILNIRKVKEQLAVGEGWRKTVNVIGKLSINPEHLSHQFANMLKS